MAGVGFELRRMLEDNDGLVHRVRGYAAAGLIASGPWIMTMLSLWVMTWFEGSFEDESTFNQFRALVTYSFAFSLLTVGTLQMPMTRQLADLMYQRQHDRVLSAFSAALAGVAVLQGALGLAFGWLAAMPPAMLFVFASLFIVIGMTWVALIWLTCIRQYDRVLAAYAVGLLVSVGAMYLVDPRKGLVGALGAYAIGQAATLGMLVYAIGRGLERSQRRDLSIFTCVLRFPQLILVGLAYNAAIWIDKIVFWFVDGLGSHPLIRFHPLYDTCSYLAYLTVLPTLALNLVHIETDFYERYRAYYAAILGGHPLSELRRYRHEMVDALRQSGTKLLRVQGAITALCVILAPTIIDALAMPPAATRVFQLCCMGAFFHVLMLVTVLVLMYFDLQRQALFSCGLFFALNGTLALTSLELGVRTYGLGYALSSLAALTVAVLSLGHGLRNLDYLTFTSQPTRLES